MIITKTTFSNGMFDCQEIYSDNGKKILETTNGQKWDTDSEHPIAIAASRVNDYVETDEPVDPNAFVDLELTENSEN